MKLHRVSPKCEETWQAKNTGPLCTGFYLGFRGQATFRQLDALAFGRYESSNQKLNLSLDIPASRWVALQNPGKKVSKDCGWDMEKNNARKARQVTP